MITFDHDHVDVNGADGWLRQSSAFVKCSSHVDCSYVFVWTLTVREQFPQRHAWYSQIRQTMHAIGDRDRRLQQCHLVNAKE